MADEIRTLPTGHNGMAPILANQVETPKEGSAETPKWQDAAAASLVVQDYERARAYLEEQSWTQQWEENDILYDAPLIANQEGTAAVPRFTVNNQSNTMADACKSGLFTQKPAFLLRPRGKTTQVVAQAWTELIEALLDRMKFRYWTGLGIDTMALHGTGVWKCGWSTRTRKVRTRQAKGAPEKVNLPMGEKEVPTKDSLDYTIKTETVTESYPWIEERVLGSTLFDPAWRTPNQPDLCGYAIDYDFVSWTTLESMRNEDCYEIPDSETLKRYFFQHVDQQGEMGTTIEQSLSQQGSTVGHAEMRGTPTTANPLQQETMLMLERWDEELVITVLRMNGRDVVIRNEEHNEGRIPHFTANWRSKKNAGWGIGMGRLIGADQRVEQGVLNHSLGLLAYQMNPAILHALGSNAPTGNRTVRAGGFFGVQPLNGDVRNAMAVMEMPKIPGEAWQMIQYTKTDSQETSGADATFMQGQLQGKGSSAARTATGAGRIAAKSDGRVQTPIENLEIGLFIPFLTWLIEQVKVKMPTTEIQQILDDRLSASLLKRLKMDKFVEAVFEVEMTAASKLAAKNAMAQQLPYLFQIFQQPQLLEQLHQEGKTVALDVLLDVLFAVSEYRIEDEIIVPMTPEEKQHMMAMQAPNVKVQEGVAREQARGQANLELEDRKAQNNLATTVAEHALERIGGGIPLTRAAGLVARDDAEQRLLGNGPSPLAGA